MRETDRWSAYNPIEVLQFKTSTDRTVARKTDRRNTYNPIEVLRFKADMYRKNKTNANAACGGEPSGEPPPPEGCGSRGSQSRIVPKQNKTDIDKLFQYE